MLQTITGLYDPRVAAVVTQGLHGKYNGFQTIGVGVVNPYSFAVVTLAESALANAGSAGYGQLFHHSRSRPVQQAWYSLQGYVSIYAR